MTLRHQLLNLQQWQEWLDRLPLLQGVNQCQLYLTYWQSLQQP
ncbi:hypothetical protein KAM348_21390 [Aeromonas caviae]|uniref:Uncharacterized protein n=1 Tax=Aeromonas caviae TaxID=648 RepID=A0AAI9KSQ0_AERCA|nr:hypothetical protein PA12_gene4887 [Pseudomonas aeruginosa]GJA44621.1 hypothetical protein KAM346_09100 [Aeromonas caviae]GJA54716.1 hypothetical protein KAM348_21390 [Aeromonas caviae]GJA70568.1 hypothetical protein KAM353_02150 [Aeromonas caviae]